MKNTCFYCGCKFDASRSDQLFCSKWHRYKYHHNSTLILPIKRNWFDMILSGIKTEEYREIKPYWEVRFERYFGKHYDFNCSSPCVVWNTQRKDIIFKNGYQKDAPQFTAECTISEGIGREEWGAVTGERYYILTVHSIYNVQNIKNIPILD